MHGRISESILGDQTATNVLNLFIMTVVMLNGFKCNNNNNKREREREVSNVMDDF